MLMALACAVVVVMFWTNDDNARQPDAVRGRGGYLPILDRGDGHMLFLMARSTAFDLDWNFNDDLAAFGDPWGQVVNKETQRKEIPHPIGPPLIWTPLLWVAHAGSKVANLFGADIPSHGYTEWHQRFVFFSSVAAAILAVLLGLRLARRYIGGAWSPAYGAIAVLLGTSVTYYATHMPSYGHALDAGACGAFLGAWGLTLGRTDWKRWLMLGALLGISMLIRVQDLALGVVVALEVAVALVGEVRKRASGWRHRVGRWLLGGAVVLGVALIMFTPQLYYWHVIYGDWRTLPQGPRYTRLGSPMILELLYSARNGWFATTPIAYLGVIGLFCVPKPARLVAVGLGLALAIQVYLNSTIIDWWGMASWGQRRLCSVTIVLVFGLAALLWRCGRAAARVRRVPRFGWHITAVVVLAPIIMWNLWRVDKLAGGIGAPSDHAPTCCETAPRFVRRTLRSIYGRIGNPFQIPASLWFAVKHDVEIQRWDQAVGNYALMPSAQSLRDDAMYREVGGWRIGYPRAEPYLVGDWSRSHKAMEKPFRWTLSHRVTAIVPNLMPYPQRFSLTLAAGGSHHVIVRWDGRIVAEENLVAGWQTVVWVIRDMSTGEHELSIDAMPLPMMPRSGWPQPRLPVGVAVNTLQVQLERPSP
jgi:hypothetical protein